MSASHRPYQRSTCGLPARTASQSCVSSASATLAVLLLAFGPVPVHAQTPLAAPAAATPARDAAPAPAAASPTAAIGDDGRWEQLSDEQKSALRAQYSGLKETDEPPYPRRGIASIQRELAQLQQKLGLEGDLALAVRVDARGSPQEVAFYRMADPYFAKVAAYVLMHSDYKPARCDGQPCAMDFRFDYRSPQP